MTGVAACVYSFSEAPFYPEGAPATEGSPSELLKEQFKEAIEKIPANSLLNAVEIPT